MIFQTICISHLKLLFFVSEKITQNIGTYSIKDNTGQQNFTFLGIRK